MLYLAASPYSASVALVAVQEENQAKGALYHATPLAKTTKDQKGAAEGQARQDNAPEPAKTSASDQASGAQPPQEDPQLLGDANLVRT